MKAFKGKAVYSAKICKIKGKFNILLQTDTVNKFDLFEMIAKTVKCTEGKWSITFQFGFD